MQAKDRIFVSLDVDTLEQVIQAMDRSLMYLKI